MRRSFMLLLILLFSWAVSAAQVSEFTLPNGLKLLVKLDHRAPVAIFQIWYRVGGSYEPNGITGISHVVEHMMFEGSKLYPDESFNQVVNANGGQLNAFTDDDYTAYFEMFAADKIPLSFKMEADRMQNLTLSEVAYKKEIQVVMEERRMRLEDQPPMRLYERLRAAAFLANPYHHMTIGWQSDLQHMTVQDARAWYHEWYAPNNATIVVVGDVDPQQMLALAKKYFGNIPARELPLQKPMRDPPPLGKRVVNVKLPAKVAQLFFAYNVPVLTTAEQAWQPYALDVLADILGGSDSSRLSRNVIRGKALAADANASYSPNSRLDNLFLISAIPANGHTIDELQQAIRAEIKQLQTVPLTVAELNQIKTQVIANHIYTEDSIETQATLLGSLASVGLPWQLADDYVQHIEGVTAEQVQAVAKEYLIGNRLTIGVLHPLPISNEDIAKEAQAALVNLQGGVK